MKDKVSSYNIGSQMRFEKTGYIQEKKEEALIQERDKQFETELKLLKKRNEHHLHEIDSIQIPTSSTLLMHEKEQLIIYLEELFEYKYEFFELDKVLTSATYTERGRILNERKQQDISTKKRMGHLEEMIKRGMKQLKKKSEELTAAAAAVDVGNVMSQEL